MYSRIGKDRRWYLKVVENVNGAFFKPSFSTKKLPPDLFKGGKHTKEKTLF
jgi:hypothetical protein